MFRGQAECSYDTLAEALPQRSEQDYKILIFFGIKTSFIEMFFWTQKKAVFTTCGNGVAKNP